MQTLPRVLPNIFQSTRARKVGSFAFPQFIARASKLPLGLKSQIGSSKMSSVGKAEII